jgi:glucose-1-phosphate cytidylyltransferase
VTDPLDPAEIPVVILCGGKGMRIRQVSELVAKPMLRIGPHPILWHIMRMYGHFGFRRFVLCVGYMGQQIKDYFLHYQAETSDFSIIFPGDGGSPDVRFYAEDGFMPDWEVVVTDTGLDTMTGARVARAASHLDRDVFMLTYGDGVGDVDLGALLSHHYQSDAAITVTGVRPPTRFGHLELEGNRVSKFTEKPQADSGKISGGFMVANRGFIDDYLSKDANCVLETDGLPAAAAAGTVALYRHEGFWMPMDNHVEYNALNDMWARGEAPWKVW